MHCIWDVWIYTRMSVYIPGCNYARTQRLTWKHQLEKNQPGTRIRLERKSLTPEYVNIKYPVDPCLYWWFCSRSHPRWGSGAYIRYNDGKAHITIATGKCSTNFKAQAEAVRKSRHWNQRQRTPNQAQYGHLHRCSLCPQQTPKSPPEWSQRDGNCPGRPRSPDKPNSSVDSNTLREPRKWTRRQAC